MRLLEAKLKLRIKALRSLRLNYKRRGVWVWLKGWQLRRCIPCQGDGKLCKNPPLHIHEKPELTDCPNCGGSGRERWQRGYQRILSEPQRIIDEQRGARKSGRRTGSIRGATQDGS